MEPSLALRGFILGFTIAAAVGPISLLVVRRTLVEGRVIGLVSGLGVATADATYGAMAAFGLGAITQVLVDARQVLAVLGGVFLLWLAWATVRSAMTDPASSLGDPASSPGDPASSPADPASELGDPVSASSRRGGLAGAYLSMLGLTLANPMTILSFGALFAGLGVTGGDTGGAGAALLTLGVLLGSGTWWVLLTSIVAAMRARVTPTWIRRINVGSGVTIGVFAVLSIASAVR